MSAKLLKETFVEDLFSTLSYFFSGFPSLESLTVSVTIFHKNDLIYLYLF
jgi:hypothetical protein